MAEPSWPIRGQAGYGGTPGSCCGLPGWVEVVMETGGSPDFACQLWPSRCWMRTRFECLCSDSSQPFEELLLGFKARRSRSADSVIHLISDDNHSSGVARLFSMCRFITFPLRQGVCFLFVGNWNPGESQRPSFLVPLPSRTTQP